MFLSGRTWKLESLRLVPWPTSQTVGDLCGHRWKQSSQIMEVALKYGIIELVVYICIEKKVLTKNCEKPVPAFIQSESFAPCFRDLPPGAVCVEKLREVRLAASRGNRVQMKFTGTGFRAVRRGPGLHPVSATRRHQGLILRKVYMNCDWQQVAKTGCKRGRLKNKGTGFEASLHPLDLKIPL